tara:strand:+ start:1425 stop:1811 length:387 start_codon:yes stop_codon:yes gene_type:complete
MKKDLDQVASIELAIKKKYGAEAIVNPKSGWTPEKEEEYLQHLQSVAHQEEDLPTEDEFEDLNGVLIQKKLVNRRKVNHCDTCKSKIVDLDDDVCYTKFGACFKCYINYIEYREERWATGWRPKNVTS